MNSHDAEIYKAIVRSQTMCQYDIAKAVHTMFSSTITCNSITRVKKIWYERQSIDEPWKEASHSSIKNKLSGEVARMYVKTAKWLFERSIDDNGEFIKPHYITIATKLLQISVMLKTYNFKNALMKQMADLFHFQK